MKINKILISQPVPAIAEKSPYYQIQTRFKAQIDYHPFIRIEGVSLKEFRSQRIEILDHTAIVLTSRTTVDHFFRICKEARVTVPETMKYLCQTEAVALYLQKYIVYRKRKIFFADGSFTNFMELILKHKAERMLLVLSEPHKPELPETLTKLKINFDRVILSRTVCGDLEGLNVRAYDMLAFFSPQEIKALVDNFGTGDLPLVAAFGEGTARAAIAAGLTVNLMAPTPEAPSMARAIELFIPKAAAGEQVPPVVLGEAKRPDEFLKGQGVKPKKPAGKTNGCAKPKANGKPGANSPAGANGKPTGVNGKPTGVNGKPSAAKPKAPASVAAAKKAALPVAAKK